VNAEVAAVRADADQQRDRAAPLYREHRHRNPRESAAGQDRDVVAA
jgi:hypothetical protein